MGSLDHWCCLCGFQIDEAQPGQLLKGDLSFRRKKRRQSDQSYCDRHAGCQALTTIDQRRLIYDKVSCTFAPTVSEEARRRRFYEHLAVPMIQSIVGFRSSFPPEISLAIASFCPDSFFGMLGTLYALEYLSHTASIVYKAPDKRPRQVRFEGRTYVAATNDQESQLGEETSRDAHTHGVLIGIDHFGIRCIAKGGHLPPHLNTEGLWWITAQAWDNLTVGLITDGIKLRTVEIDESIDIDVEFCWQLYAWDDPSLCFGRLRIEFVQFPDMSNCQLQDQEFKRMRTIELRGAKGISFRWAAGLVAVGAHASDRDLSPYGFRTGPRRRGVDIYVPLEETETVKEIWHRSSADDDRRPILKFVTSHSRTIILGSQPKRRRQERNLGMHRFLSKKCSRFYADTGPDGMTMMAFDDPCPKERPERESPRHPKPFSPYPEDVDRENFVYTCADLEEIGAVQPCSEELGGVSGLMLHHRDGRRFCVGEVHLGRMEAALEVGTAPGMSFYFSEFEGGYPYVQRIEMMGQDGDGDNGIDSDSDIDIDIDSDGCLTVQWSGLLEWWVSDKQCKLHYEM